MKNLPSLTEVRLAIPNTVLKTGHIKCNGSDGKYDGPILLSVTNLILNANTTASFQSLLNMFSFMFPSLDYLEFNAFCGLWKPNIGAFQLELGEYSLKTLAVDITPMATMIKKHLDNEDGGDSDNGDKNDNSFGVIEIVCLENSRRKLCKLSLCGGRRFKAGSITDSDLEGLTRRKDYLLQSITISNLEFLKLKLYNMKEVLLTEETHADFDDVYVHDLTTLAV